jgi:putative FmdB family regulatory protein
MPIYEYACQSCGKTIDVLQKISDPTPAACTACGAEGSLSKVVSRSSFVLKGGGWYSDLYAGPKPNGAKDQGASKDSTSKEAASTSTSTTKTTKEKKTEASAA